MYNAFWMKEHNKLVKNFYQVNRMRNLLVPLKGTNNRKHGEIWIVNIDKIQCYSKGPIKEYD